MKKTLLFFALLCAFAQGAWAQNTSVWDGHTTSKPNYEYGLHACNINTAAELAYVRDHWTESSGYENKKFYELKYFVNNNIDMGDWSWTPMGNNDGSITDFTGGFICTNHNYIRINISGATQNYQGLFARIGSNGWVTKVHLIGNISCTDSRLVGGICGENDGRIEDCWVSANVSSDWHNAGVSVDGKVGGITGDNDDGTISYCCMSGNVTNNDDAVGGIAGCNDGTIDHVTFYGNVYSTHSQDNKYVGDSDGSLTNTHDSFTESEMNSYLNSFSDNWIYRNGLQYSYSIAINEQGVGHIQSDVSSAYPGRTIRLTKTFGQTHVQSISVTKAGGGNVTLNGNETNGYTFTMPHANVTVTVVYATPSWKNHAGTSSDPYRIATATDWNEFGYDVNNGNTYSGKFVKLTENIGVSTMVGTSNDKSFQGTFDGDNHDIAIGLDGFSNEGVAPFRYIKNATIKNLTVSGWLFVRQRHPGGIVGFASGTNLIESCTVTTAITTKNDFAGGILGHGQHSNTTIRNCVFAGTLSGYNDGGGGKLNIAGIWGWSDTDATLTLENCIEKGSIGNIASWQPIAFGTNNGTITDCYYYNDKYGSGFYHPCDISGACKGYDNAPANGIYKSLTVNGYTVYSAGSSVSGVLGTYSLNSASVDITPVVTDPAGTNIIFGTDFTATLNGNPVAQLPIHITVSGEYTLTLTGTGKYAGSNTVEFTVLDALDGQGTQQSPYLINNNADWITFADNVNNSVNNYSGQFVKLNANISVMTMIGTSETVSFQGTFLGNEDYTLTFTKGTSESAFNEQYCAPFRYVKDATIQDLKVAGDIYTSQKFAAGLVGRPYGTTNITNCQVSTVIHSSVNGDGTHGGIVAMPDGNNNTLTISGSKYNGRLLTTNGTHSCSGFVGWHNSKTINISNSFYAPDPNITPGASEWNINNGATFVRGANPGTNCFFTEALGTEQGIHAYTSAPDNEITKQRQLIDGNNYYVPATVSGIEAIYELSASPSIAPTVTDSYDESPLTLGNHYTAKLNNNPIAGFPVNINTKGDYTLIFTGTNGYSGSKSISFSVIGTLDGQGDEQHPYLISSNADWVTFANNVNSGTNYNGEFVKLTANISVTTMIGTSEVNSFQGTFLVDGVHTLTFTKGINNQPFGEQYCAPFRYVKNATIQDLKVAGDIYTSQKFAAGLVGRPYGTTSITNCQVSTVIHSSVNGDGTHGGIVAMPDGDNNTLTISGSTYNGRLLTSNGTNKCGGFIGWHNSKTINVSNSLYAPDSNITPGAGETAITDGATFVRGGNAGANCYYTETLGTAQGIRVYTTIPSNEIATSLRLADGNDYYVPCTVSGIDEYYDYTGDVINISPTVTSNDNVVLTAEIDYTYSPTTVQEPGEHIITITGIGNGAGIKTIQLFVTVITPVTSTSTTLTTGEYYVYKNENVNSRITIDGDVVLNLGAGTTLNAPKGIELSSGNMLTINGPGALTINGCNDSKSGIGAGNVGTLIINGGTINVRGGFEGAGIGGDRNNTNGGAITINGGVVNVTGGDLAAGIGGGYDSNENEEYGVCGYVTINGGQVTATGGMCAAGIGAGYYESMGTVQQSGYLTLGWTNPDDFVRINRLKTQEPNVIDYWVFALNGLGFSKLFVLEGTDVFANRDNLEGKKIVPCPTPLSGEGSQDNPYIISSTYDWNVFADIVNKGNDFRNLFVKLTDDINVSMMVGASEGNSFKGTFLGNDKTLTFSTGNDSEPYDEAYCAPFRHVKNATICDLKVTGDIYTSQKFAAGLVARNYGTTNITNCLVSTVIHSSTVTGNDDHDGTHGGIVAMPEGTLNITGCTYFGRMLTTNGTIKCGGFVGWHNSKTINISNSFYLPNANIITAEGETDITDGATFVRGGNAGNHCYYSMTLGTAQGMQVYTTAPESVIAKPMQLADNNYYYVPGIISGIATSYELSASPSIEPVVTIFNNPTTLELNNDYTATLNDSPVAVLPINIDTKGDYTLIFTGEGDCVGSTSVNFTVIGPLDGDGSEETPYIIGSNADWITFVNNVNSGTNNYSGKFVKLTNDIDITTPAGSRMNNDDNKPFSGTFLGNNKTITVALNNDGRQGLAPFRYINGATIKDLKVAGTITSSQYHTGGVVGFANGTNTIEDCVVTATLNISTNYAGGIIGHGLDSETTIRGCVFAGTINGVGDSRNNIGGIWGWSDNATPTLQNCLEAGTYTNIASMHPMGLQKAAGTIEYCYYVNPQVGEPANVCTVSGANQVYSITADEYVTIANAGAVINNYSASGLTFYTTGIKCGDEHYAANGDVVSLTLDDTRLGYYIGSCNVSAGTITGTVNPYSLTMPESNVTIHVTWMPNDIPGEGTSEHPYTISNNAEWESFCAQLELNADVIHGYVGKIVKLTADITVSAMAGTDPNHTFRGTFDGDSHTLTFNIGTAEEPCTEEYCSPFRYTYGATIKNLKTDGVIITSNIHAGGVVGRNGTSSVTLNNVSSNVTIISTFVGSAYHGGLVGYTINGSFTGCAFTGKLIGETNHHCGGMLGQKSDSQGSSVSFTNCLFAPTEITVRPGRSYTFAAGAGNLATVNNSYYTDLLGTGQGLQVVTHVGGLQPVGEPIATYTTSGITIYANGIKHGDIFYYPLICEIEGYGEGNGKWAFIASPVEESIEPSDVTNLLGNVIPETNPVQYDYDLFRLNAGNNQWENYVQHNEGFVLENGKGYLYATKEGKALVFNGTFNTGTEKTVALSNGFNLVGNPFIANAYVSKPFYQMNAEGTDIVAIDNYDTYTPVTIPPCTGIVVRADGADNVTFSTSASQQQNANNNGNLQMTLTKAGVRNDAFQDKAIVSFNQGSQLEKFVFNERHAKLYIPQYGEDYAIAFSDMSGEVPLNFKATETGRYTIGFNFENVKGVRIQLIDKIEDKIIDLNKDVSGNVSTYTFMGSTIDRSDRFTLVFTQVETDGIFAYQSGNDIIVSGNGELQVFDVMGRMVMTQYINGVQTVEKPEQTGVYIFRLNGMSQKIVVK